MSFILNGIGTLSDHTIRITVRSTNDKDYYHIFFMGSEELVHRLEEGSISTIQKEMDQITKRTDFRIRKLVYQSSWRPNLRIAETFQKGRVFLVGGERLSLSLL